MTVSRTGPQRSYKELGVFVEDADDNGANCTSAGLGGGELTIGVFLDGVRFLRYNVNTL